MKKNVVMLSLGLLLVGQSTVSAYPWPSWLCRRAGVLEEGLGDEEYSYDERMERMDKAILAPFDRSKDIISELKLRVLYFETRSFFKPLSCDAFKRFLKMFDSLLKDKEISLKYRAQIYQQLSRVVYSDFSFLRAGFNPQEVARQSFAGWGHRWAKTVALMKAHFDNELRFAPVKVTPDFPD